VVIIILAFSGAGGCEEIARRFPVEDSDILLSGIFSKSIIFKAEIKDSVTADGHPDRIAQIL
jgi:hypothetical protein